MKNYLLFLAVLFLSNGFLISQHELSFSLGTVVSGYDLEFDVDPGLLDSPNYSELEISVSPKVGLNINLGYAYYFKYNLRAFVVASIQQQGYSVSDSYNYEYLGNNLYDYEWNSSGKVDMNCFRSALGVSYLTDFNMTFSVGFSNTSLMSRKSSGEYSSYYPNNPSYSYSDSWESHSDTTGVDTDFYYTPFFLGIGYEIGDISFDLNINSIEWNLVPLNSVSFLVGYRKVLFK